MNIQVQCCGIFLLLILMIFYINQKKLNLLTEKAFMLTFMVSFVSIILDVLSIVAIVNREALPAGLLSLICKTYLVSLICVSACYLHYVYVDVYSEADAYKQMGRVSKLVVLAAILVIYALPICYWYQPEKRELYTYGPCVIATYTFVAFYLLTIIFIMKRQRDKINPNRFRAVQIWLALWIVSATLQALNNSLLLVGYAESLGIMILYLKLENPEANLDRKTALFNENALKLYLEQFYAHRTSFSALSISFERSANKSISFEEHYQELSKVIYYLEHIPECKLFKYSEELILVMGNTETATDAVNRIKDLFVKEGFNVGDEHINPTMIFVPEGHELQNVTELLQIMVYARENTADYIDNILAVVGHAIIEDLHREKRIQRELLSAIEQDRVEVFYQPIYSIREKRFVSAEALVRMRDEEGNLISPGLFVPIAEKNGLIIRLGEIVFEKVCSFIRNNRLNQYGIHYIEVNLSVVQCADEYLAKRFISIMEKHHVNPSMINLEITESATLGAKRILLDNMWKLINYGVKFSLDDFGTGQSNLNYIVDMPVDIVKFDKDMLNAYFENGKASYVVDAAIRMIHGMGLQIVSEGIETRKQYTAMEELGISFIQGYYFSRPLPEQEFLEFLVTHVV